MKVAVKILPRKEVLDSQGRAVLHSLSENGFSLNDCKVGKYIVLELPVNDVELAKIEIEKMADLILYNPLIETYEMEFL